MTGRVTSLGRDRVSAKAKARAERRAGDRNAVLLALPVAFLLIIGLGAIMSASSVIALREFGDQYFYIKRQVMFAGLGVVAMAITARIPYRWYERFAGTILALAVIGLVAVLVIGEVRGGSRRWIAMGPLTVQPSEFAKFAVVVFLAAVMTRKEKWLHDFRHFAVPVASVFGIVGALLLAEPDLGTTLLIGGAGFFILLASRARLRHIFGIGTVGAVLAVLLAFAQPYRRARILGFLDPMADPLGNGLQAVQSLVALGTGGVVGVGLGASRARWLFLPNAHTDFIFAIIGEETGLIGSLTVVALFTMFTIVGTVIAYRAPDRFGRLLVVGLVAWLSLQAIVNVGGVTAVLPITGVPLPFVSAGGSSLVVNFAVVGIIINVARNSVGRTAGASRVDVRR